MRINHSEQTLAPVQHPAPEEDRRSAPRFQTVLRVGRVVAAHDEGLARIRNISDQGAHLRIRFAIHAGESLALELAEGVKLNGRVVWTSDCECGLQFDQPIDCGELLATLAAVAARGGGRPVRLPVAITAVTRSEIGLRLAKVTDVSQRGMKISHDGSLRAGLSIKITLASGLERLGVVRWSKNNFAGVMLLQPLSADDLGSARNL